MGHAAGAQGNGKASLEFYRKALALQQGILQDTEAHETGSAGRAGPETAYALGAAAWYALYAREFDLALRYAEQALALEPEVAWIRLHRAHALLCLGRQDEARLIYASSAPVEVLSSSRIPAVAGIANDFRQLRLAGISLPTMSEIEASTGKRP